MGGKGVLPQSSVVELEFRGECKRCGVFHLFFGVRLFFGALLFFGVFRGKAELLRSGQSVVRRVVGRR